MVHVAQVAFSDDPEVIPAGCNFQRDGKPDIIYFYYFGDINKYGSRPYKAGSLSRVQNLSAPRSHGTVSRKNTVSLDNPDVKGRNRYASP